MSHKQDRLRAQSGTIFRDGKLRNKKDWDALHPSKQGVAEEDVSCRAIVPWQPALDKEHSQEDKSYVCAKCGRTHKPGSKVYQAHREHMTVVNPDYAMINIPLEQGQAHKEVADE